MMTNQLGVAGLTTVEIDTRGPFSLAELGRFGFGAQHEDSWDGVWRLAFVLDHGRSQAAVAVRQVAPERLSLDVQAADDDVPIAVEQVRRVSSCNHDGRAFAALADGDPVLRRLIAAAPGLRPPLFASPYEGALWSLLSQRRSRVQARRIRDRLAAAHGAGFEVAGQRVWAAPTPAALAGVTAVPGLPGLVVPRLHTLAEAALAGQLDVDRLTSMPIETAMAELRRLPGIGEFSAALIMVRACGLADELALNEPISRAAVAALWGEPISRAAVAALWGEPEPFTDARYVELAQSWRPFCTWVTVLARAAGSRLAK